MASCYEGRLTAIEKNEMWELVALLEGKKTVGLKWIFKTKYNSNGSVPRHEARLVTKGYSQLPGMDFEETFSLVVRLEIVRVFLVLDVLFRWLVYQFDVKLVFLNGVIREEVFVEQPEGFTVAGSKAKVYKLRKALYGLRQAPNACKIIKGVH